MIVLCCWNIFITGGLVETKTHGWHPYFDYLPEPVILIDTQFRVLRVNEAAVKVFGLKREEMLGQFCFRVVHGEDRPPKYCPRFRQAHSGAAVEVQFEEPRSHHTFNSRLFPVTNENGEAAGAVIVLKDISLHKEAEFENTSLTQALAHSFSGIIEAISELSERRDPYTAGHARGVAGWAVNIGREMGMEENELQGLWASAILHDIGKITISSSILNKSGKLSPPEWEIIKTHPETAYEVLSKIAFPWPVAEVVYQHQERMDGSGYPRGLKGDEIHPWARIVAVADVIDAMITHRPYRPALSRRDIAEELTRGRGKKYDEKVVDIALRLLIEKERRVLIVDDEPVIVSLIENFLKRMDKSLEVRGFTDPISALEAFQRQPFAVVVTDVNMPEMSGLELLRRVREIHPATKVIIITGVGEKQHTVEALRLGASDFLEKPLVLDSLQSSVETMLRRYEEG